MRHTKIAALAATALLTLAPLVTFGGASAETDQIGDSPPPNAGPATLYGGFTEAEFYGGNTYNPATGQYDIGGDPNSEWLLRDCRAYENVGSGDDPYASQPPGDIADRAYVRCAGMGDKNDGANDPSNIIYTNPGESRVAYQYLVTTTAPNGATAVRLGYCAEDSAGHPGPAYRDSEGGNSYSDNATKAANGKSTDPRLDYILWRYGNTYDSVNAAATYNADHFFQQDRTAGGVVLVTDPANATTNAPVLNARTVAIINEANQKHGPWTLTVAGEDTNADGVNDRVVATLSGAAGRIANEPVNFDLAGTTDTWNGNNSGTRTTDANGQVVFDAGNNMFLGTDKSFTVEVGTYAPTPYYVLTGALATDQDLAASGDGEYLSRSASAEEPTSPEATGETEISDRTPFVNQNISDSITITTDDPDNWTAGATVDFELELIDAGPDGEFDTGPTSNTVEGDDILIDEEVYTRGLGTHNNLLPYQIEPSDRLVGYRHKFLTNSDGEAIPNDFTPLGIPNETGRIQAPTIDTRLRDALDDDQSTSGGQPVHDIVDVGNLAPDTYTYETEIVSGATTADTATGTFTVDADGATQFTTSRLTTPVIPQGDDTTVTALTVIKNSDGVVMVQHVDRNDADQQVTVRAPSIRTQALDTDDENQEAGYLDQLIDTVIYTDFAPGNYTANADWQLQTGGTSGVTATLDFTVPANAPSGSVDVGPVEIPVGADVNGWVAFETVDRTSTPPVDDYATHEDPDDPAQAIAIREPVSGSFAEDDGDREDQTAEWDSQISDTYTFENYDQGDYEAVWSWTNTATDVVEAEVAGTFTVTEDFESGSVTSPAYTIPNGTPAGEWAAVVNVYRDNVSGERTLVETHNADYGDPEQLITIVEPAIGTRAYDILDGDKLVLAGDPWEDEINYMRFDKGEYRADAVAVEQGTGTPLLDNNGEQITATLEFTVAEDGDGIVVVGPLDSLYNFEGAMVAFEKVYKLDSPDPDKPYATHEDPDDPAQTVTVVAPYIKTRAVDQLDGDNIIGDVEGWDVDDHLEWYEFVDGNYTATVQWMFKDTGKPVEGKTATVTFEVIEGTPEGVTVVGPVSFEDQLPGNVYVAFEEVTREYVDSDRFAPGTNQDTLYAEHKDITDEKQTLWLPELTTKISQDVIYNGASIWDIAKVSDIPDDQEVTIEVTWFSVPGEYVGDLPGYIQVSDDPGPLIAEWVGLNCREGIDDEGTDTKSPYYVHSETYKAVGPGEHPSPKWTVPEGTVTPGSVMFAYERMWTEIEGERHEVANEKCGATDEMGYTPHITTRARNAATGAPEISATGGTITDDGIVSNILKPGAEEFKIRLSWFFVPQGAEMSMNTQVGPDIVYASQSGPIVKNGVYTSPGLSVTTRPDGTPLQYDDRFMAYEELVWTDINGDEQVVSAEKFGSVEEMIWVKKSEGRRGTTVGGGDVAITGGGVLIGVAGLGLVVLAGGLFVASRRRNQNRAT